MRRAVGALLMAAGFWRQNLRAIPLNVRATTLSMIVGLVAVALAPSSPAFSHDHERPELKAWFKGLKSKAGAACCDDGEAEHAEAVWDMVKRRLQGLPEKSGEPGRTRPMVRRAAACGRRTAEPQRRCDGVVVAILRHRWNDDAGRALLHSRSRRIETPAGATPAQRHAQRLRRERRRRRGVVRRRLGRAPPGTSSAAGCAGRTDPCQSGNRRTSTSGLWCRERRRLRQGAARKSHTSRRWSPC